MFFSRKLFSRKPLWGIPKHLSVYKTYKDYGGFDYLSLVLLKKMTMYSLVEGFQIDTIISDVISENKRKFFKELDAISLKKVTNYYYSNAYDKCCGTDDCYFCTIIDYVHQEFRGRRENNKCYLILHKGIKITIPVTNVEVIINYIISCIFFLGNQNINE